MASAAPDAAFSDDDNIDDLLAAVDDVVRRSSTADVDEAAAFEPARTWGGSDAARSRSVPLEQAPPSEADESRLTRRTRCHLVFGAALLAALVLSAVFFALPSTGNKVPRAASLAVGAVILVAAVAAAAAACLHLTNGCALGRVRAYWFRGDDRDDRAAALLPNDAEAEFF